VRALAHLRHVGAQLLTAKDRQLVSDLPRVFDRVVEAPELAAQRLAAADPLDQPELLEVRDVAEVPSERAEDRRVDLVELLVGERLDEEERPPPCLLQTFGGALVEIGRDGRRDSPRLQSSAVRLVNELCG